MRKRFFEHARTIAKASEYKYRHGALLVNGGTIIKSSYNKTRFIRFARKYHEHQASSVHAEIGCVLNLDKNKTYNCDIYVCRINAKNEFAMSKPCDMCQNVCREMGIKKIYYTEGENIFKCLKL